MLKLGLTESTQFIEQTQDRLNVAPCFILLLVRFILSLVLFILLLVLFILSPVLFILSLVLFTIMQMLLNEKWMMVLIPSSIFHFPSSNPHPSYFGCTKTGVSVTWICKMPFLVATILWSISSLPMARV
jgi:hypothetical protein